MKKRENALKKVQKTLNKDDYILFSQDEASISLLPQVTRKLVKRGSTPYVESPPGRKSLKCSGFVQLGEGNGRLFLDFPKVFNFETAIESIRKLLSSTKLDKKPKNRSNYG